MDYPSNSGGSSQAFTGPPPSYSAPVGAAAAAARHRGRQNRADKKAARRETARRYRQAKAAKAAPKPAPAVPKAARAPFAGPKAGALGGLALTGPLIGLLYGAMAASYFYDLGHGPIPQSASGLMDIGPDWEYCGTSDCTEASGPTYYHSTSWNPCPLTTWTCGQAQGVGTPIANTPQAKGLLIWGFIRWHNYPFSYVGDPLAKIRTVGGGIKYAPSMEELWADGGTIALPQNPAHWPQIDPLSIPIQQPMVQPQALPWRILPKRHPNPYRSPTEQTERGNDVAYPPGHPLAESVPVADPLGDAEVAAAIEAVVSPADDPSADGTTSVPGIPEPYAAELWPKPRRVKPRKRRSRPRKNEREGKANVNHAVTTLMKRALSTATEGADHLKCAYKALPAKFRSAGQAHRAKAQDMASDVWDHFYTQADVGKFLFCLIENELEDRIIGGFGKLIAGREARHGTNQVVGFVGRTRPARQAINQMGGVNF